MKTALVSIFAVYATTKNYKEFVAISYNYYFKLLTMKNYEDTILLDTK